MLTSGVRIRVTKCAIILQFYTAQQAYLVAMHEQCVEYMEEASTRRKNHALANEEAADLRRCVAHMPPCQVWLRPKLIL